MCLPACADSPENAAAQAHLPPLPKVGYAAKSAEANRLGGNKKAPPKAGLKSRGLPGVWPRFDSGKSLSTPHTLAP